MLEREQLLQSQGGVVIGSDGSKIGTIDQIYVDRETEQPEWVLVNTGLLGARSSFVPLSEARVEGAELRVPYDKDRVKGAPTMDAEGELSQQEEAELYAY